MSANRPDWCHRPCASLPPSWPSQRPCHFHQSIRMQIGVMFGNPETTPGGKALKFYTSVRLDIRRIAQIKKGDEVMGAASGSSSQEQSRAPSAKQNSTSCTTKAYQRRVRLLLLAKKWNYWQNLATLINMVKQLSAAVMMLQDNFWRKTRMCAKKFADKNTRQIERRTYCWEKHREQGKSGIERGIEK